MRQIITDRQAERPPPLIQDDQIVATSSWPLRTDEPGGGGEGDLVPLDQWHLASAGRLAAGSVHGADGGRRRVERIRAIGLVQMAFPLKMLLHPDGHITSVRHSCTPLAGPTIFDVYERQDEAGVDRDSGEGRFARSPGRPTVRSACVK